MGKRKTHSAAFQAQVALVALRQDRTLNELARQRGIQPTLMHAWKKQLLASADDLFRQGSKAAAQDHETRQAQRDEQIGRLPMALDWVKNKAAGLGWRQTGTGGGRSPPVEHLPAG